MTGSPGKAVDSLVCKGLDAGVNSTSIDPASECGFFADDFVRFVFLIKSLIFHDLLQSQCVP
jgi:hypothetical protein